MKMDFVYWCRDCGTWVDRKHRCQQWSTVSAIPAPAIEAARAEERETCAIVCDAVHREWDKKYYGIHQGIDAQKSTATMCAAAIRNMEDK